MRRNLSWLVLFLAVVILGVALPALRTPPAPAQETAQTTPAAPATDITVAFSRDDDPRAVILGTLGAAHNSVLVAMYCFTDRDLAAALVAAQQRGVQVYVFLDRSMVTSRDSVARSLVQAGVPVRISNNPKIMHNKFAVVDGTTVITGSYNWTISASKYNDENVLRITRPELAQRYTERFGQLWDQWDPALTAALNSPRGPGDNPERN